jgi:hypothetical protein
MQSKRIYMIMYSIHYMTFIGFICKNMRYINWLSLVTLRFIELSPMRPYLEAPNPYFLLETRTFRLKTRYSMVRPPQHLSGGVRKTRKNRTIRAMR